MNPIPESAFRGVVGLPYVEGACGPGAYDCMGAMKAVLRAAFGIEVDIESPPIDDDSPWRWISASRAISTPGTVMVTRAPDGKQHVWTVLDRGRALTSLPGRGVCIVPIRLITRGAESVVGCYLHTAIEGSGSRD